MQILANALPGFRDLRAPLVAGYLWLVFAWLLVDPNLNKTPKNDLGAALYHLGHKVGHIALALAIGILAYLIGSISQGLWEISRRFVQAQGRDGFAIDAVSRLTARRLSRLTVGIADLAVPSLGGYISLQTSAQRMEIRAITEEARQRVEEAAIGQALDPAGLDEIDDAAGRATVEADRELELPATLLVGNQPALFGEVDRLRAEGDLRAAVVLPGLALAVLGIVQSSGWWAFAIPFLGVLLFQAFERDRESRDLIANAMSQGIIKSQSVERYRNWATRVNQPRPAQASPAEASLRKASAKSIGK
jgi:hypothetical protein